MAHEADHHTTLRGLPLRITRSSTVDGADERTAMKYVFNGVSTVLCAWPALVAGYIFGAVRSGWSAGRILQEMHEDAAIEKFVNKGAKP